MNYNLSVGLEKINKKGLICMSREIIKLDVIIDNLEKRNQSDGCVKKFYYSPTPYYNLKKENESIPYERPYEKKLAEQNLPTDNKVSEEVLEYFFQSCDQLKMNDDLKIVLSKVTLLNAFYRTTIDNINLVAVARYICSLNFDELISMNGNEPNFDLVEKLAYHQSDALPDIGNKAFLQFRVNTKYGIKETANNLYSFATKYCAWHQPKVYPIVDSFTKGVLHHLVLDNKELKNYIGFSRVTYEMLNDYKTYYNVYQGLRSYLNEKGIDISMKELDIFLWSYGVEHSITA